MKLRGLCGHMGCQSFSDGCSAQVRFINYGRCYYFEPPTLEELDHVDAAAACRHFTEAFQNPAEFRLCLTGNLEVSHFPTVHVCKARIVVLVDEVVGNLHSPVPHA